jgi:voltage-gated potassium channel Kch
MVAFILLMFQFSRSIIKSLSDPEFRAIGVLFLTMLGIGTVFYSNVEGWSLFNSLYFSVMTLATVGYGDYSPKTTLGKTFTIFYVLIGISILLGFVNTLTKHSQHDPSALREHIARRRVDASTRDTQADDVSSSEHE